MKPDQFMLVITGVVAISAAMLVWFAIDIGTVGMARYRAQFTERTKFQADEFFLSIDPRKLFFANLAVMALGTVAVVLATGNVLTAVPTLAALAFLPRGLYHLMRRARMRRFEEQMPDALMMLAGSLRAGSSMTTAIQQLVSEAQNPLAQEFSLILREQRLGVTWEQSLNNLARRMPSQTTILVVSAMRIANETGGGLALPVWIDYMAYALRGVPIEEPTAPEGVVNQGGEWFFDEFTRGAGVSSLGLDDKVPEPPTEEEKKSILDIFKR